MDACPITCEKEGCACYEDSSATNSYGLDCATIGAAGYCGYTEAGLWPTTDANLDACPITCAKEGCSVSCHESAAATNSYGLDCATIVAAGYCGYTEAGLWSFTDANIVACPASCGVGLCACAEDA